MSSTPPRPLVDVLRHHSTRRLTPQNGLNGLLAAVNAAFDCHYPLTLSPDGDYDRSVDGHCNGRAEVRWAVVTLRFELYSQLYLLMLYTVVCSAVE